MHAKAINFATRYELPRYIKIIYTANHPKIRIYLFIYQNFRKQFCTLLICFNGNFQYLAALAIAMQRNVRRLLEQYILQA